MPVKSQSPDVVIPDQSLYDFIINRLRKEGEAVALIDNAREEQSMTFKQVDEYSQKCAGFLYHNGLRKGDVVALCTKGCVEYPAITLAILACGASVAFYHSAFTVDEMKRLFTVSQPKMAFVDEDIVDNIKEVKKEIENLKDIFVFGRSQEFANIKTIMKKEHKNDFPADVKIKPVDDVAFMLYSSGTTGLPKCVMLTHKNMVSYFILHEIILPAEKGEIYYTNRPIPHISGLVFTFAALMKGMKVIMDDRHDLEITLQAIEKYRVTRFLATPANMILLVQVANFDKYDTSSLRTVMCGGAALSTQIVEKMAGKLTAKIVPCYGSTEAGVFSYNLNADCSPSSVGTLIPNHEAKIIDLKTGEELLTGKDGEILVKSSMVMKGYLRNDEANKEAFTEDGWLRTGDLGHFDNQGRLYITARIKEIIKYGAYQVSPAELESVILEHPKIADVGVIGIPDDYDGELPKAFVVKKDHSLTATDVISFLHGKVIDYKQLRGGVEFVDKIPKSVQGKIQRLELKKLAGI